MGSSYSILPVVPTGATGWNGNPLVGSVQLSLGYCRQTEGTPAAVLNSFCGSTMVAMNSSAVDKFWQAAHHMAEKFVDRLPALLVAVVVFIAFYAFSLVVDRIIRRSIPRTRQNLGVVFARLTAGATILLGFLVAFSIVTPSFQAADLIKILGIGGVAIGFAFQNILQNFLAGLLCYGPSPSASAMRSSWMPTKERSRKFRLEPPSSRPTTTAGS